MTLNLPPDLSKSEASDLRDSSTRWPSNSNWRCRLDRLRRGQRDMAGRPCKCGCGERVPSSKRYVDKAHRLAHMRAGEASRLNALQPVDAKRRGGSSSGRKAAASGRLAEAGQVGAARVRAIAEEMQGPSAEELHGRSA